MPNNPDNVKPLSWFQRQSRTVVTFCIGAGMVLVGAIVILVARAPSALNTITREFVQNIALGVALMLGGSIIAAVAFAAWCRGDGPTSR